MEFYNDIYLQSAIGETDLLTDREVLQQLFPNEILPLPTMPSLIIVLYFNPLCIIIYLKSDRFILLYSY